jgi:NAD(P)-dependent dehydrogenase (short-subunit alcohol dehydrogenase family)
VPLNRPIRDWRGKRVWIVGASTGIGASLAMRLSRAGARLAVSARSADKLAALGASLSAPLLLPLDVRDAPALAAAYATILQAWGGADLTVFNAGMYSAMRADAFDLAAVQEHFTVNYGGVVNGLAAILPDYLRRAAEHPALAIVSSVAGYRGLPQSLAYGPSKAALINLAESLYLDLAPLGIGVTIVNPGFVDTPMTRGNAFPMPALTSADQAAAEIVAGLERGRFEIDFPRRFTRVLKLLRLLPYAAYFSAIHRATGL